MKLNRILFLSIFILFFCSEKNSFRNYENTKWTLKLPFLEVSFYINKIFNNNFTGEIHKIEPECLKITYIEGQFIEKNLIHFREKNIIFDSNESVSEKLSLNQKYLCKIKNDSLIMWEENDKTNNISPLFIRDKYCKTKDDIALTQLFEKSKQIKDDMLKLAPNGFIDFKNLEKAKQIEYADLFRKNTSFIYESLDEFNDIKIKLQLRDYCFERLIDIYITLENPKDLQWLQDEIKSTNIGDDGYYKRQTRRINIVQKNRGIINPNEYFIKMTEINLSQIDQVQLMFDLVEMDICRDFVKRNLSHMLENDPENVDLKKLSKMVFKWQLKKDILFPNLEFTYLNGKKLCVHDLHGKFILIDCWHVHCPPCIADHPKLINLNKELSNENFCILSLCTTPKDKLNQFLEKHPLDWPQAIIKWEQLFEIGIYSWPQYFLINPDGKIIATTQELRNNLTSNFIKELL